MKREITRRNQIGILELKSPLRSSNLRKRKKMKETENLRNLLGTINHTNICIMSPGRKREKGRRKGYLKK